jgi:hypothetical protein
MKKPIPWHRQKDLFDRRGVKMALFVAIPAIVFLLVSAGITVSRYGIDHTILVFCQSKLVAGWPAALRVALISDDGRFFLPERMTGRLVRDGESHLMFDGAVADRGYALARNFKVPKVEAGPADLELTIYFDKRRRTVKAPITVVDEPPREPLVVPKDIADSKRYSEVLLDTQRVQVFTEDRGAPTGLSSVIFVRSIEENGTPASIDLQLVQTNVKGENQRELTTDRVGLAAFAIRPLDLAYPMKVPGSRIAREEAAPADGGLKVSPEDAHLFPKIVYGGITATAHNPLVRHGESIRLAAGQIASAGPVYADVFHQGRWVQAVSSWFSGGRAMFEIMPATNGLLRVQLTTNVLSPGNTVAVRHFYSLTEGQSLDDAIRELLKRQRDSEQHGSWVKAVENMPLESGAGYDRRLLGAFVLATLYEGHAEIPTLISSRKEDDAELLAFKNHFKRGVMVAILALGLGVSSLIVMMAVGAFRRQQRITQMILMEGEDGDELEKNKPKGIGANATGRVYLQGFIVFLIILAAFASIALLIDTMTWY